MNTLLLEHFDQLISTPEDVEKLNHAILQLAIRGKLVEQDSKDEPACKLLNKIQEEKGKDFKFTKTYQQGDEPFELPTGWEWVRFGDATINRDGERIPLSKEVRETRKGKYDYYGASGVIDNINDYLFDKPLLLIGEDGANLINRSTPIAFIAKGKYWVNNHAHVIDAIDFSILKYLEVFINAIDLRPYITGTAQPKMNQAKMNSIILALPPLAEQGRIVARVEELFAQTRLLAEQLLQSRTELDRLNESALAHLLASETPEEFNERWGFIAEHFDLLTSAPEHIAPLRQSILELAVRGKLTRQEAGDEPAKELLKQIKAKKNGKEKSLPDISETEKPVELPEGWEWTRLNEILLGIEAGKSFLAEGRPAQSHEFGVIKVSAVTWGEFDPSENKALMPGTVFRNEYSVKANDLLITRANTAELVGAVVLVHKDYPNLLLSDKTLRLHCASEILKPFLVLALRAPWVRAGFADQAIGTSSSMRNISQDKIRAALIAIPPLAEQERIVKRVEQLLGWCDALEAQLQSAEEERGRLMESVLARVGL